MLGVSLLIKQTSVFFVLPCLYSIAVLRKGRRIFTSLFFLGFMSVVPLIALGLMGWKESVFWIVQYPLSVLGKVRSELFSTSMLALYSAIVFALASWPVWYGRAQSSIFQKKEIVQRNVLKLWFFAGVCALIAGKALFFHYYLLIVPSLVLLFFQKRLGFEPLRMGWLLAWNVLVCVVASIPSLGVFWGTDLTYYSRVGEAISRLSSGQNMFIWGGNALPLIFTKSSYATRFVTSRFATSPYATSESKALFRKDFIEQAPELIVDLHERGDDQFNVPVSEVPWLKREMTKRYSAVRYPDIPWATFYVLKSNEKSLKREPAQAGERLEFDEVYEALWARINKRRFHLVDPPNIAQRLSTLYQLICVWDGLRTLIQSEPQVERHEKAKAYFQLREAIERQPDDFRASDSLLAKSKHRWLVREYEKRGLRLPQSMISWTWLPSLALVHLQPVFIRRESAYRLQREYRPGKGY
jgi:hypothetical protein